MRTTNIISIVAAVLLASPSGAEEIVDFKNDLIPVFTKSGCNAGACHGAAIGRGGLKLSLYGGDPEADFEAIVRQMKGRRINLAIPEESLILLKPTEFVEHGGGAVFEDDSKAAGLIVDWIHQGALLGSVRDLRRLTVSPKKFQVSSTGEVVPLRAIARYSDGTTRDVTRWTVFKAEDASAVEVSLTSAKVMRRGRHVLVARYLHEVEPIELIAPLTDSRVDLESQPRINLVDEEILDSLKMVGIAPSNPVDDTTFLRRITLDLTGRLPLASRVDAPLDRSTLLDALLMSKEFTEYWTLRLSKLLRMKPQNGDNQAAKTYHSWLKDQIRRDASYRQIAYELITASGDSHSIGPASFYRTVSGAREQTEFVSELFMGSRLRCANCHNHPLDRWTQDDYHGLAAIFAKIDSGRIVRTKPSGEVIHPRTLEPAVPKIPGEAETVKNRKQLANWLTDANNPYFAKAIVNRLWKHMLGRGLVDPVDDFRATNPATHPLLLDKLAEDFVANGYSLRHTLRVIAESATYARSSDATNENQHDDSFYSHAFKKPLETEVLADAISDVLGVASVFGNEPVGKRAVALLDPTTRSMTLDILGRCDRVESCENSSAATNGLPQKLHLLNGDLLNARIAAEGSRLKQLRSAGKSPMEIVRSFYLVALCRGPTVEEQRHWKTAIAKLNSSAEEQAFLEDFVWGLLSCHEFTTNH